MTIEIKVPSVGESVTEALLAEWFKEDGDRVDKNEPLFVLETDKVTLEVEAEAGGQLKILVPEGETVAIGAVVGTIDPEKAVEPVPAPPKVAPSTVSCSRPEARRETSRSSLTNLVRRSVLLLTIRTKLC